ncbi:MAG: hypothetical protein Q4G50_04560 [Corynebacterium sp.]|uniref:hypothetical protein n=1 Tax=Corynebacterium sp. TaxID=1720 RepID=UPI0026DEA9D1|nr:hypothetical protein [Corynebacterium sp.]MDO5669252.1 hypothetical protein [Corynebacterium sp.]
MDLFLGGVVTFLVLNFVVALVAVLSRPQRGTWLLVLLLSGTTGAAVAAVLSAMDSVSTHRGDLPLTFTALAAVSALVAVVGYRTRLRRQAEEEPSS